jgi:hypothetical protein
MERSLTPSAEQSSAGRRRTMWRRIAVLLVVALAAVLPMEERADAAGVV